MLNRFASRIDMHINCDVLNLKKKTFIFYMKQLQCYEYFGQLEFIFFNESTMVGWSNNHFHIKNKLNEDLK